MFQISKLLKPQQDFLIGLNQTGKGRDVLTSLCISRALNKQLNIPNEQIESVVTYYNLQHRIKVQELISKLNEIIVIDTDAVLKYTCDFYCFRYSACTLETKPMALVKETALTDFFGISKHIDQQALNAVAECPSTATSMVSNFIDIFETIK